MTTAVPALKRIREEQGFKSRRRFARALNVSRETPMHWERGRVRPLPHHAQRLEDLLGLRIDELLAPESKTTAS